MAGLLNVRALRALALIFGGCCANVVTLEYITKNDKQSGVLVTLAQFVFVSIMGLAQNLQSLWPMRLKPRKVPVTYYFAYAAVFWTLSTMNNAALGYDIALPLHMIFRSGSLVTSLALGVFFLRKRYPMRQVLAVVAVTAGIYVATSASVRSIGSIVGERSLAVFGTGVAMLTGALVLSSALGIFQEHTYSRFGKCESEMQFFSHAVSLLFFLPLVPDALARARSWNNMALVQLPNGMEFSMMWVYLLANMITQQICITGVFEMTAATSALAMTLAITLRKFVSLVFSILWFGNHFTSRHWLATALVFIGSLVYSWPTAAKKEATPQDQTPSQKKTD